MPKHHKTCPFCGKIVGGTNPSILEINYALHTKKHELHGGSQNLGILQRISRLTGSIVFKTFLGLLGFFAAGWTVTYLNRFAWPWVYLVFPPVFFSITSLVWFGARKYRRAYSKSCARIIDWILSIVIGGLLAALAGLVQGLYPFYQNPYILMVWGLFFLVIADIIYLQDRVDKLVQWLFSQKTFF